MSTTAADIARAGKTDVYRLFAAVARRTPEAVALDDGRATRSYGALHDRILRLADALTRLDIGKGDRVALLSENRAEYAETELACAFLGAIVACQNWRLAPVELKHCIELVSPKLIIVSARHVPLLVQAGQEGTPIVIIEDRWEQMIAEGMPNLEGRPNVDPEDGLVILYTSGTTGMPKGALISHRAEIARNSVLRLDLRVTDRDGFVAWAPMFHMGSTDQVLGSLMSGSTVHIVDGFDAERVVSVMETSFIGWMLLMPGSIEPVVDLLRRGRKVRGVRAIGAMADLVPLDLIAELSGLTRAPYLNSFGSTETGLPPASGALLPPGQRPDSLSKRKSSLCEIRLVDEHDREVAIGDPGEVAVCGPTIFSGYWNAPETNAKDFRGGWFHMGDLFRANADGTFDFVDRSKYMIKSGGENIYPAEIERVLLSDSRVSDAVVIKKIDPKWGEIPVAFVSRKNETLDVATIDAMCRQALAGYKRPREVHFIAFEEFPRSTTGKIQRHEMEHWLISGKSSGSVVA